MQTMANEARKTHFSHKELQCKQWVKKQRRLIVHTRNYNATMEDSLFTQGVTLQQWVMNQGRLIIYTRSYNANNG
ncbi:hypothetical protein KSS87_001568 [Heliosperma pusillum]|nr:hypothetical protein KSS87_001568 [Heliosperma pusillum]